MKKFSKAFHRNLDGSWTCVAPATLEGPNGRVQVTPGSTFTRGTMFMGVDLARWLDELAVNHRLPEADAWHSPRSGSK
jgi:hypothetical protein